MGISFGRIARFWKEARSLSWAALKVIDVPAQGLWQLRHSARDGTFHVRPPPRSIVVPSAGASAASVCFPSQTYE